jgi:hypothetical protein
MKYIIPQEKLFWSIYEYIDYELRGNHIYWEYDMDYNNSEFEETSHIVDFMGDDYRDDTNRYFSYIKKEYYEMLEKDGYITAQEFVTNFMHRAPLLSFSGNPFWDKLKDMFGDLWRPVFKKWFETNYPEFEVKTFIFPGEK